MSEVINKATIYRKSDFIGIVKSEVKNLKILRGPYAQYADAIFLEFVPAGKRKAVRIVGSYAPYFLILNGHGHPEPGSAMELVSSDAFVTVQKSKYLSFDPRYTSDFDAEIAPYLAAHPEVVAADLRDVKVNMKF